MSCFIVENRTVNWIAAYIDQIPNDNEHKQAIAKAFNLDPETNSFLPELAAALFKMNVDAFLGRYQGRHADDIREFRFAEIAGILTAPRVLKLLSCYTYNCHEYPVTGTPQCAAMDAFEKWLEECVAKRFNLKKEMIHGVECYDFDKVEEYREAPWG